jgi:hypothetical protein
MRETAAHSAACAMRSSTPSRASRQVCCRTPPAATASLNTSGEAATKTTWR